MQMKLHLYQYGQCAGLPGISIGVARQAPRGIRVEDRLAKGYFQIWIPLLAPSRELMTAYRNQSIPYEKFALRYRKEMKTPEAKQAISLLAALCQSTRVNLGCFCQDESKCHRSQLFELIRKAVDEIPISQEPRRQYFSPPCSMPEIED